MLVAPDRCITALCGRLTTFGKPRQRNRGGVRATDKRCTAQALERHTEAPLKIRLFDHPIGRSQRLSSLEMRADLRSRISMVNASATAL